MTALRFLVNGSPVELEAPGMRRLLDLVVKQGNAQ